MSEQPLRIQSFNPNDHLIQIKGHNGAVSDYLPVQWV
jgi:hypothetical protein